MKGSEFGRSDSPEAGQPLGFPHFLVQSGTRKHASHRWLLGVDAGYIELLTGCTKIPAEAAHAGKLRLAAS